MKPVTGSVAERWLVNWTDPIVLFRKATLDILSSAASNGCARHGNAPVKSLIIYNPY
jgi:hypothetical protein